MISNPKCVTVGDGLEAWCGELRLGIQGTSRGAMTHPTLGTLKGMQTLESMPNYHRPHIPGGTYFITQVTYARYPWLCTEIGRTALRHALKHVQQRHPFQIRAIVLLPDHFHTIWTLPPDDGDFSTRMRLVKRTVTKYYGQALEVNPELSISRRDRKERNVWQRRFWEHLIRDKTEFTNHCNYIHNNPVKHGLCSTPQAWPFSSFHRFIQQKPHPPQKP